jgi:hypothetical protein
VERAFPEYDVELRHEGWRWLQVQLPDDADADLVARAMERLVGLTRPVLDATLGVSHRSTGD